MEVGLAIRRPEQLVLRWQEAKGNAVTTLISTLLLNAVFGIAAYGVTMQMHKGALAMLRAAVLTPLSAGSAWLIALPALYIFNSALGSRMSLQATVLAASITVCFGSWAMLASVPINWFFSLALPYASMRLLTNLVVFTGVGVCMIDVFIRVLETLEPERSPFYGYLWIGLVAVIGMELFSIFGIFSF
jgi:hypothetical protein